MKPITVVIVNREEESPYTTLSTLAVQSDLLEIVVVYDEDKGANWARNRGAELAQTEYILFSDNDVEWEPNAVQALYEKLKNFPTCGYSYGWYVLEDRICCNSEFDARKLRAINYISTMSLVRKSVFCGFDEKILRLQDWDLWLSLLKKGITGVYCGQKIFSTDRRDGITFGSKLSWEEARKIVMEKHKLL
jgi:glycosyltransferase involved in cell wall biosynthesis